jgi:hypothetical protein
MLEIKRKKNGHGYDVFDIITDDGTFEISYENNLDLYWRYIYRDSIDKVCNTKTFKITKENLLYKIFLKANNNLKNAQKKEDGLSEKEKDAIKETIKDFTMDIFTSKDIQDENNKKKDIQKIINTPFGRQFFVGILSKNFINIILLKEKPFQLLGTLIYNSLLHILNIKQTNKLWEQTVILIKSTKYFGKEIKGKTTTLWDAFKSKLQAYSKINQNTLWEIWYKMETKQKDKINKEKEILKICDIMIELELDKIFIKNVIIGLAEKELGKDSDDLEMINDHILSKIKKADYIYSRPSIM